MSPFWIELLSAERARLSLGELAALLEDAVESRASVGFLLPLGPGEALRYWEGVLAGISSGDLILSAMSPQASFRATPSAQPDLWTTLSFSIKNSAADGGLVAPIPAPILRLFTCW